MNNLETDDNDNTAVDNNNYHYLKSVRIRSYSGPVGLLKCQRNFSRTAQRECY